MNKYKSHIILAACSLFVGFGIGIVLDDLPLITIKPELSLSDVFYIIFIVILGYAVQTELQTKSDASSKKHRLLERLHEECFTGIQNIGYIISENVNTQVALDDYSKKDIQLAWRIISQKIDRIADLCKHEQLKEIGADLHNSILSETFPTPAFKYDAQMQKDFIIKSERLKSTLDKLIYMC